MQGGILPTEEKLITDDSVPKRIYLNLPRKRSMFFFLMNESNVYDSKFIFKMEKTKNDLNFPKKNLPTAKRKEDVRINKSFCCRPSFFPFFFLLWLFLSSFSFLLLCVIYIFFFYLFMLLIILLFYSISM